MIRAATLIVALVAWGSAAVAQAITPAQYRRATADAAQRLDYAAAAGNKSRMLAEQALEGLPERVAVQAGSGLSPVYADNRQLLRALRSEVIRGPRGIRAAARVLRNLESNLGVQPAPALPNAWTRLVEVLRRREFRPNALTAMQRAIARVMAAVADMIARAITWMFARLPEGARGSLHTWRIIMRALLIVVGAFALFLVVRLVIGLMPRRQESAITGEAKPVVVRPHAAWLAEAETSSRAHDYRVAMRALHMAALMKLDEAGLISYVDSRTDGRFVQALRETHHTDQADALAALNHVFSLVWYGQALAGPHEYDTAREHWMRLEAAAAV